MRFPKIHRVLLAAHVRGMSLELVALLFFNSRPNVKTWKTPCGIRCKNLEECSRITDALLATTR